MNKTELTNSTQQTSCWNWLPTRKTAAAIAAFGSLAATVIGITYVFCTTADLSSHSYEPLTIENPTSTAIAGATSTVVDVFINTPLVGLGLIAANALAFNRQRIEEKTIPAELQFFKAKPVDGDSFMDSNQFFAPQTLELSIPTSISSSTRNSDNLPPLPGVPAEVITSSQSEGCELEPIEEIQETPILLRKTLIKITSTEGQSITIQLPITDPDQLNAFLASAEFDQLVKNLSSTLSHFTIEEIDNCDAIYEQAQPLLFTCKAPPSYGQNRSEFELPKDRGLTSNFKLAEELLKETRETIIFSPNNLARSRSLIDKRAEQQGVNLRDLSPISHSSYLCENKTRTIALSESKNKSLFTLYKITAELTEQTKIGVCFGMAAHAFFKGMEKGAWNTQLDLVSIKNGDHIFVVIGRKPGSDPKDYTTWGSTAVVLDPWAGKIFKLSEVETQLDAYLGYDEITGEPQLTPFDPKIHSLLVNVGNICSQEELLVFANQRSMNSNQTKLYEKVVQKLRYFHQNEHFQTKLNVAERLHELCTQPEIAAFSIIKLLAEQVEYFIELGYLWKYLPILIQK